MAENIKTLKRIGKLYSGKELRKTEYKGTIKWDIRHFNSDDDETNKYDKGIRFTDDEINQLDSILSSINDFSIDTDEIVDEGITYKFHKKLGKVGNFDFSTMTWTDEEKPLYCFTTVVNGRMYKIGFVEHDMITLKNIFFKVRQQTPSLTKTMAECLDLYDLNKAYEQVTKKKAGRPKKETTTKTDNVVSLEKKKAEKKVYKDAYDKFVDMFAEYRKTQPKEKQRGYELTHNIITAHIKDIIATSDDYNKNAMQEWKNSYNLVKYVENKSFENADMLMAPEFTQADANRYLCQWVDEYIGLDDKPKPKSKPKKKAAGE